MANIQSNLNKIKNAFLGIEVRDSIHDAIKQCYDDASAKDNANMEVKMARGEYENLGKRLDSHSSQINEKAKQSDLEVERKRIDNLLSLPEDSSINDARLEDICVGAYGITYDNPGEAVRTQFKNIYEEVRYDIKQIETVYPYTIGYRVNGYNTTTFIPNTSVNDYFRYTKITELDDIKKINSNGLYTYSGSTAHMFIYLSSGKSQPFGINGVNTSEINSNEWYILNEDDTITIDVKKIKELYTDVNAIYICMGKDNLLDWSIYYDSDLEKSNKYTDDKIKTIGITEFDLIQNDFITGYRVNGYNTTTKTPNISSNSLCEYIKLDIDNTKYVYTKGLYNTTQTVSHNFLWIGDKDNCHLKSLSYDKIVTTSDWFEVGENITIDIEKLLIEYPTAKYIYITMIISDAVQIYKKTYSLLNMFDDMLNLIENQRISLIEQLSKDYSIVLPKKIHAVVGQTINLWVDNFIKGATSKDLTMVRGLNSDPAQCYNDVFIYQPTKASSSTDGTRGLIRAFLNSKFKDENSYQFKGGVSQYINYVAVPNNAGNGITKNVMFIGDSITENGYFLPRIKEYFDNDVATVNIVGTYSKTIDGVECASNGHAGWSAKNFCQNETFGSSGRTTNEFWNASTSSFDFSQGVTNAGISNVDYVFINLGTNDNTSGNNETFDEIIAHYDDMITSIRTFNSDISIFIGLTLLQSNTLTDTSEMRYRVQGFIQALINHYDNREDEKIYVVPLYTNMANEGFGIDEIEVNPILTNVKRNKPHDKTHPNLAIGGPLEAAPIIAAIKYAMWKENGSL